MDKLNIKPLGDRVVVEPAPAEEKTESGIIIPDTAKEKPQQGTVVAVPDNDKDNNIKVKAGDRVLYGKYAGTEITLDGKDYLILNQSDILAII
ncbi:co-chaperone GroES [Candidatus Sulfidibacterium hydrothermale]|uniref:co-chaperone GroES n=1 Tax=Candidatus Sulfidibacterium hydrothermale TaxID=2875962 RepID=UPI001F0B2B43|nr:co-chaperone GroES [Candidatus Sulfidibacterium hydrothermale]UBM62661.1 co-chaperone GroES [Candidatus Sulfidibacterium hydrothermale]